MVFDDAAESLSVSLDLAWVAVFLTMVMVPVVLAVVVVAFFVTGTTLRRVNVLSCRFNWAVLSTNFTSFRVAVSVVLVRTNFGPELFAGPKMPAIPTAATDDAANLPELVRVTSGRRGKSFFQCVSTRGFTFFRSFAAVEPFCGKFSFEPADMAAVAAVFLSFSRRVRLPKSLPKLPSAGRIVTAASAFLICSRWWFYANKTEKITRKKNCKFCHFISFNSKKIKRDQNVWWEKEWLIMKWMDDSKKSGTFDPLCLWMRDADVLWCFNRCRLYHVQHIAIEHVLYADIASVDTVSTQYTTAQHLTLHCL